MTLQLLMGLFGIGPIILAIGLAINQIRGAENWHSWFVGEDNQFWISFQELELMYVAAFLTYLAIHGRDATRGGGRGAAAPPDFGRSVNPISTRGG